LPTFEVSFTEPFERCLRKLKRKYRRLRGDMEDFRLVREIAFPNH
jgi:ribosomal protein S21